MTLFFFLLVSFMCYLWNTVRDFLRITKAFMHSSMIIGTLSESHNKVAEPLKCVDVPHVTKIFLESSTYHSWIHKK